MNAEVYCAHCRRWYKVEDVEILDYFEGVQGEDNIAFECPDCKTQQISKVRVP